MIKPLLYELDSLLLLLQGLVELRVLWEALLENLARVEVLLDKAINLELVVGVLPLGNEHFARLVASNADIVEHVHANNAYQDPSHVVSKLGWHRSVHEVGHQQDYEIDGQLVDQL